MRELITAIFELARAVLFAIAHVVVFLTQNSPSRSRREYDGEEEFGMDGSGTFGRTASGTFEPSTTSARGESVGIFSGSRMK